MGRLSRTLILAAGLLLGWWTGAALAQTVDHLLGSNNNAYVETTPKSAVTQGLPVQSGAAGNCLKTDGSALSWGTCGSGGGASLSNATPKVESGAGNAGDATDASRGDHAHPRLPLSSYGAQGAAGTCAKSDGAGGLRYGDCGSPRPLATLNPKIDGSAAPGTRTDVSRSDHVHPSQIPSESGQGSKCLKANTAGTGLEFGDCGGGGGGGGSGLTLTPLGAELRAPKRETQLDILSNHAACVKMNGQSEGDIIALRTREVDSIGREHRELAFFMLENRISGQQLKYIPSEAYKLTPSFSIDVTSSGDCDITADSNFNSDQYFQFYTVGGGGGGGGGSNPTIPQPTAAAKLKHLRVNATGAAYELADPPTPRAPSTAVPKVESGTGAVGDALAYARGDHVHPAAGGGGGGAPLSNSTPQPPGPPVPGDGTKASRDDHVHAPPLLSEVTPKVAKGGGNPGTNVIASRDDHVHPAQPITIPYATGVRALAVTGTPGTQNAASRGDHAHQLPWPNIAQQRNKVLAVNSDGTAVGWTVPASGVTLSDNLPKTASDGGRPGVGSQASRDDHSHPVGGLSNTVPAAPNLAGLPGESNVGARADHVHPSSTASGTLEQKVASIYLPEGATYQNATADDANIVRFKTGAVSDNLDDYQSPPSRIGPRQNRRFSRTMGATVIISNAALRNRYALREIRLSSDSRFDGQLRGLLPLSDLVGITGAPQGWTAFAAPTLTFTTFCSSPPRDLVCSQSNAINAILVKTTGIPIWAGDVLPSVLPPDLTDEVEDNEGAIEHLDAVTSDLIAGDPPAGWTDSPNAATAGIWLAGSIPSLAEARAGTYSPSISSGTFNTKVVVVRLPSTTSAARARVAIAGVGAEGAGVNELVTGYRLLGASSDGSFKYYRDSLALGSAVTGVKMQTTTAAHIGTSQYEGLPTRVKGWAIKGSGLPVPVESLPFGTPWVKLYNGNFSGTGQINIQLPNDAGAAIIAAQRDTEGAGVYRQFLVQFAWNIGTGEAEELVQTQALLPGVLLDGSVGQAGQGLRYYGVLPGLDAVCPIFLKASTTAAALLGNGSCQPDWGNQGNAHPTVYWNLWGRR